MAKRSKLYDKRYNRIQEALKNPQVRLFLDSIAFAEGVDHGYHTMFGNEALPDLNDHPGISKTFKDLDGKVNKTSAAGRYQFIGSTWKGVADQYKLPDFGPHSQDVAALALLLEKPKGQAALEAIETTGDFRPAYELTGSTWVSLPTADKSKTRQNKKTWDDMAGFVASHEGNIANFPVEPPAEGYAAADDAQVMPTVTVTATEAQQAAQDAIAKELFSLVNDDPTQLPPVQATASAEDLAQLEADDPLFASLQPREPEDELPEWLQPIEDLQRSSPQVAEDEEFSPWESELLSRALEEDIDRNQQNAVRAFFGEEPLVDIDLPLSIEDTINKYLTKIL